jgi:hypothetical protein
MHQPGHKKRPRELSSQGLVVVSGHANVRRDLPGVVVT